MYHSFLLMQNCLYLFFNFSIYFNIIVYFSRYNLSQNGAWFNNWPFKISNFNLTFTQNLRIFFFLRRMMTIIFFLYKMFLTSSRDFLLFFYQILLHEFIIFLSNNLVDIYVLYIQTKILKMVHSLNKIYI